MHSGRLNKRVLIDHKVVTRDAIGGNIESWVLLAPAWAEIRYLSGVETIKADAPVAKVKASIRIRRRADVAALTCRVRHGGTIFSIHAVLPAQDNEYIFLACEAGANSG